VRHFRHVVLTCRSFSFTLFQSKGTLTTAGPNGESTVSLAAKRRASYDLKGCNDDKILERDGERLTEVHKRIWQVHMWCGSCCWSPERKVYYQGKQQAFTEQFHVTPAQKDSLMQWLRTAVRKTNETKETMLHVDPMLRLHREASFLFEALHLDWGDMLTAWVDKGAPFLFGVLCCAVSTSSITCRCTSCPSVALWTIRSWSACSN